MQVLIPSASISTKTQEADNSEHAVDNQPAPALLDIPKTQEEEDSVAAQPSPVSGDLAAAVLLLPALPDFPKTVVMPLLTLAAKLPCGANGEPLRSRAASSRPP
jgi:hypothetical protein